MAYKIFALSLNLLEILPTVGPGISARIRCMARPSVMGSTAMANTSTPMPPTQWEKLRQYSVPWLRASTSVRMVEPVVVKPETVSKKASIKDGISPEITKGSAPKTLISTQTSATMARPSRAKMVVFLGVLWLVMNPSTASSAAGNKNAGSRYHSP